MKFDSLDKMPRTNAPSELASAYVAHDRANGTLEEFLLLFEFESEDEIYYAIRTLIYTVVGDKHLSNKYVQEQDVNIMCVWRRFKEIACKAGAIDKYPRKIAQALWNSHYARRNLDKKTKHLIGKTKPDEKQFAEATADIKQTYDLTDLDMEKIHFFVEQVKAGEDFPDSLRRMLYIWGVEKKTGKTTCARMITCILNGELDWEKSSRFQSTLQNEMQVGSFKVPLISACNVVMMDECFFADMGKMYADFKRFLTSRNGRARLPYGDEFQWYGLPNYIATSNDSLQKFIKDWNDRRYLSVNFHKSQRQEVSFARIYVIWLRYIVNSTRTKEWQEWANEMYDDSNEIGERQVFANEFEVELRQNAFLTILLARPWNASSVLSNENRITLKYFVDYFADHNPDARKRRGEIEDAVMRVFGEKHNGSNFWLMDNLREKAAQMINDNNNTEGGGMPF